MIFCGYAGFAGLELALLLRTMPNLAIPTNPRQMLRHFLAMLLFFVIAGPAQAGEVAEFAILNSRRATDYIWTEEVDALKGFLTLMGRTYREVGFEDLNRGELGGTDGRPLVFRALLVPGGYLAPRVARITPEGNQNVRSFVEAGGGYVGFCAGAHQAAKESHIAYVPSQEGGTTHTARDYQRMPFPLFELFDGIARGPYDWAPYKLGSILEPTLIDTASPTMKAIGASGFNHMLYHAGPTFKVLTPPPGYEVWARTVVHPNRDPRRYEAANQPSIIKFNRGLGSVVLFSQHPVFLAGGHIAGHELQKNFDDAAPTRNWHPDVLNRNNILNWNLLNAALQVAIQEQPQRIDEVRIVSRIQAQAADRSRRATANFTCEGLFTNFLP